MSAPHELPHPPRRVLIELKGTKKRYALDVRMSELPEEPAEVVEIMPPALPPEDPAC